MEMNRRWRLAVPLAAVLLAGACSSRDGTNLGPPEIANFLAGTRENAGTTCMGTDAFKSGLVQGMNSENDLNCTSNDVSLAEAIVKQYSFDGTNFTTLNPGDRISCTEGQKLHLKLEANLTNGQNAGANDIGVWLAMDGGDAKTGTCSHWNLLNGDGGNKSLDGDMCGDIEGKGTAKGIDLGTIQVTCTDPDNDGKMQLGACLGWTTNQGGDRQCPVGNINSNNPLDFRYGTLPGTKAKCNCDPFDLPVDIAKVAFLQLDKACAAGTTGGNFQLKIDNVAYVSGATSSAGVACGGTTGKIEVGAGSTGSGLGAVHNFREDGFNAAHYLTPSWACVNRVGGASRGNFNGAGPHNITLDPDDDVICTVTNQGIGSITIRKETEGGFGTFNFDPSANLNSNNNFSLTTASGDNPKSITFNSVVAGSHSVEELLTGALAAPSTWDFISISGTGCSVAGRTVTIAVSAGSSTTCTFLNRRRASVTLAKRQNGGLPLNLATLGFQIRSGATAGVNGTVIATSTIANTGVNTATGVITFPVCNAGDATCRVVSSNAWVVAAVAGTTYQVCETGLPVGWTTSLETGGFTTPDGAICKNVTLVAGATGNPSGIPSLIDNVPPPGGPPRTIGYWRNWASCAKSNGNHYERAVAAGNIGWTLDGVLAGLGESGTSPLPLGDITTFHPTTSNNTTINACDAVNLLSKRDKFGTNRANDAAYALAAQLLAAKLNKAANAQICAAANTAIATGQSLLDGINFLNNGASYASPQDGHPQRAAMLAAAATLDSYNNGTLCP